MPRVPTKSNIIAIDDNDFEEEKSYDNYIDTSKSIITTTEQFENILTKNKQTSESILLLKDSTVYNNEQPDWAYYSSKPDLFPIDIQSKDQHLSLKQTILSYFHRHPKFTSVNNPATFHSSSLNANNHINSNLIPEQQQHIAQKLNHLKQRIFRVRKSRIIISFDDIQQTKVCLIKNFFFRNKFFL